MMSFACGCSTKTKPENDNYPSVTNGRCLAAAAALWGSFLDSLSAAEASSFTQRPSVGTVCL